MRDRLKLFLCLFGASLLCLPAGWAGAQTLNVGMQTETSSMDPHLSITNPSIGAARHMFDTLAHPDADQKLQPGLALSWAAISETEWEFRLRPDVRFHDGIAFTAEDVVFALTRARDAPSALASFGVLTKQIAEIQIVDPHTIRLRTARPFPLMAEHLSPVPMLSRAAVGLVTADFNAGKGMIGTGPYRFVSWAKGDSLRLTRNDAYWGKAPGWRDVTIRVITDDGARVAALLSGTVDVIDLVPTPNVAMLRAHPGVVLSQIVSNRIIFLGVNVTPAANPRVSDAAGAPLAVNPLADRRVRLAMSMAINREAMTRQVMEGLAIPASQLLPDGYPGTSAALKPEIHDPAGARALLAEAGFPNGFALTLMVARDRNANDVRIGEAAAQMLSRIGVRVTVDALPFAIAQPRHRNGEFALSMRGWGTETGEGSMALRSLLGTRDAARGWGLVNGGGYSNPAMDALLERALATMDPPQREALVAQATELGIRDMGLIPLHYQVAIWGLRKGLAYTARSDSYTFAFDVRAAPVR